MLEDFSDHLLVLYERDHSHWTLATRTYEGIHLVECLNKTRPTCSKCAICWFRFEDAGYLIVGVGFSVFRSIAANSFYPFEGTPEKIVRKIRIICQATNEI